MRPASLSSHRQGGLLQQLRAYLVWGARHAWLLEGPIRRADRETASHDTTPLLFSATTAVRSLQLLSSRPSLFSHPFFFYLPVDLCPSTSGTDPCPLLSSLFSACTHSFFPIAYYLCSLVSSPLVSRSFSRRRCSIGSPNLLIRDMSLYKSPLFRLSLSLSLSLSLFNRLSLMSLSE